MANALTGMLPKYMFLGIRQPGALKSFVTATPAAFPRWEKVSGATNRSIPSSS